MFRVQKILANRWVLGIVGLIALSCILWFGLNYIKFGQENTTVSSNTRIILISVIWCIWFIWRIATALAERQKNSGLVADIQKNEEKVKQVNPDDERTEEESSVMLERFNDAMSVLKKSRFGVGSSSKSLYQLPWYIIIGPPGAGKTTALVNSGLEFPLAKSHGKGALGGVGGTRNCDWWFTNDAVLIDTAGRYTTQDSHRVVDNAAWNSFLALLKKYRRRRPINGAIVAISIQDLILQTAEQRMHHAKIIRTRIDELHAELGVRFPVYLNFTKCDLISGFSEFFSNLSQAEREQVWGVTFDENNGDGGNLSEFLPGYEGMVERLNGRVLWRVHQERSSERRALIQGFPERMESMGNVLNDFIQHAFSHNRYNQSPMLRGVYFSSATQEGTPIDRMMASVSATFGLSREAAKAQQGSGKSYFLQRLLKDVIFPESDLVGLNPTIERSMRWFRRVGFSVMLIGFVGVILLWTASVTQNKLYMNEVESYVDEFSELSKSYKPYGSELLDILPALDALYSASLVYSQENSPWLSSMGLYNEGVDRAAKDLYNDKLKSLFLPYYVRDIERQLHKLTTDDPQLFESFRVYMMLMTPSKRNDEEILEWTNQSLQARYSRNADKQERVLLHLNNLLTNGLPDLNGDDRTVARARKQLQRIPVSQRLYQKFSNGEFNSQIVDLYDLIGGDTRLAFGVAETDSVFSIPYQFTKDGYDEADLSASSDLLTQLSTDRWIFGDVDLSYSDADKEKLSEDLKRIYLSEYGRAWKAKLASFSIARFSDFTSALESLYQLSDPVYSPLLTLLELGSNNTLLTPSYDAGAARKARIPVSSRLRNAGTAAAEMLINKIKPTSVDIEFRELHRLTASDNNRTPEIQNVLTEIGKVRALLNEIANSSQPSAAAFDTAKSHFSGTSDSITKLRLMAVNLPEPTRLWVEQIADHSWRLILNHTKRHINNAWHSQIYTHYQSNLKNSYPLQLNAGRELSLLEFDEYFNAEGRELRFVNEYLKPFINTRTWRSRVSDGRSISISKESIEQFKRADNIRNAYFSQGGNVNVGFKVTPIKLDSSVRLFSLELGDEKFNYSHGPRIPKNLSWTAGEDSRIRLLFEDLNETLHRSNFEGDWSWFKLLDNSTVKKGAANTGRYTITFKSDERKADFNFESKTSVSPFNVSLLRRYRCLKTL
ncbi:MAG: type VI secretion system protein ImpL [Flavobacteriales bacterium]|jgi:type VI secretion system protein ImpL